MRKLIPFVVVSCFTFNLIAMEMAGQKVSLNDDDFGRCMGKTEKAFDNYKELRQGIKDVSDFQLKALTENQPHLASKFKVPLRVLLFIRNLHSLRPVFIQLKTMLTSKDFAALKANPVFSEALGNTKFLEFISTVKLDNAPDSEYKALMTTIQGILKIPGTPQALKAAAMDDVDLSKIENLDAAITLDDVFNEWPTSKLNPEIQKYRALGYKVGGSNIDIHSGKLGDVPLMVTLPFPKIKGLVADNYRELVEDEMKHFLLSSNSIEKTEAHKAFDLAQAKALNTYTFDSQMPQLFEEYGGYDVFSVNYGGKTVELTKDQVIAIDGLVRTLYGEVNSCEGRGIEQATLVGKIVADRGEAVRLSERRAQQNKFMVDEKLASIKKLFENSQGVTAVAFAAAFKTAPFRFVYGGKADFGRADVEEYTNDLFLRQRRWELSHPVTQVISRGDQFSGWRSFKRNEKVVNSAHANLPTIKVVIKDPLNDGDISALYNQICPKTELSHWKRMLNIAKSVVIEDSKSLAGLIFWKTPVAQAPLFYTHEVELSFVDKMASLPALSDRRVELRGVKNAEAVKYEAAGPGCSQIKLWTSRNVNRYFPDPSSAMSVKNQ